MPKRHPWPHMETVKLAAFDVAVFWSVSSAFPINMAKKRAYIFDVEAD